jgi:ABC-type polar amino acid transport system ATPase subunit
MIRIRGLSKSFGAHRVLDGVEASVERGEIVAIVGPSGCGKSTLLRCLNGLEPFDAGTATVSDFELGPQRLSPKELTQLRSVVGMVFQDFQLFPHLTALENVTLAPRVVRGELASKADSRGRALLEQVGLGERASAYPAALSGGQKQRVAIARSLAQGVRVLLLDEPTSALDPAMREEVRDVLRRVARDGGSGGEPITMLLVTHDMRLVKEIASRVWIMADGKISRDGDPESLAGHLSDN